MTLLCFGCIALSLAAAPAPPVQLSGSWALNREASEFPAEVGFDPEWLRNAAKEDQGRSEGGDEGRGGRRGGGGGGSRTGPPPMTMLSEDEAKQVKELVEEVKSPPPALTISQSESTVTITDGQGSSRVFHTNGKEGSIPLHTGGVAAIARWEGAELYVRLRINKEQELRYRYSRDAQGRLVVRAQLADHNKGEVITRVYTPK